MVSFLATRGAARGPSPWYAQVLLAPMLGLAFLGASRWRRLGKAVTAALTVLFGYVLIATYLAKLIPLYGGYEGRTSLRALVSLYSEWSMLTANLDLTALGASGVLSGLIAIVVLLALALMSVLTLQLATAKTG